MDFIGVQAPSTALIPRKGAAHVKRKRDESDGRKSLPMLRRLNVDKFQRGSVVKTKGITDKKLKSKMKLSESRVRQAAVAAARTELLLLESEPGYLEVEGIERTYRVKQDDIAKAADVGVARKRVDLALDTYGPYHVSYSRNGRYMLLGGEKGHIAMVDWNRYNLTSEFHVNETIHDITFLHNTSMFAVAQKKYAYIYDHTGMEIHCLRNHIQPLVLDFLPHHFLLTSVGNAGVLKYQDVSTGALVAEHKTKLGSCNVMRQNPWNGVMCLGHSSGVVTMWTPNLSTPVVKMLCHRGPVTAIAVDLGGRYAVTGGLDGCLKVWDIRNLKDHPVHNYFLPSPAHTLDVSQRGLVAVGYGSHVQVWGRDFALEQPKAMVHISTGRESEGIAKHVARASAPYLRHELPGKTITELRFRPYDDILAIGHSGGISSMIVPGSGEPNYDSREADPFQRKKARQEAEVHALLDKLNPATITRNPRDVLAVDMGGAALRAQEAEEESGMNSDKPAKPVRLGKARSKSIRRMLRRNSNVITAQREALKEKLAKQKAKDAVQYEEAAKIGAEVATTSALSRFYRRHST